MKVYVVISSYQHGLGEAVEVDAEVFSTIDKARKAIGHKGMNTLENYKRVLNCDDYLQYLRFFLPYLRQRRRNVGQFRHRRTRIKIIKR